MNNITNAILATAGLTASIVHAGPFELAWDDVIDAAFPANGNDVASDSSGNVYVVGDVGQSLNIDDWITAKYDAAGNQQWIQYFNGPANNNDSARLVQVGADDSIYVGGISYTGGSFGEGPKFDVVVIRYSPDGDLIWQHTFNSSYNNDDFIEDMVVMPDGSVYVVGYSYLPVGQLGDADYVIYRISPTGELMWSNFWDGPFDHVYWLRAAAEADASGVSVAANTAMSNDLDIFSFVKFSPNGKQLATGHWEPPFNSNLPDTNWLYDAALDSAGNMIMVGRYDGPYSFETGPDQPARAVAIKFSSTGDVVWVAENDTELSDEFNQIVLDAQDNVFLSGTYNNAESTFFGDADHVTAAYDADGNFLWEHRFGFDGFFDGEGFVELNDAGELIVATGYYSEAYNENVRFLRYDRMSGAVMESMEYDRGDANDRILGMDLDPSGNPVIAGWTRNYTPEGGYEGTNLLVAKINAGEETVAGDLNGDSIVNQSDLGILLAAFNLNANGDLDGDNDTDQADLGILLANFGAGR